MARDDDRDLVVVERNDGGSALKWLMVGAVVGAGLALLFAPSTGKTLRGDLRRGMRRARRMAEDAVGELKDSGADRDSEPPVPSDGGVYEGDDDEAEVDETDAPASPRRRPERPSLRAARDELEQRLAAARERRRQPVPADDDEEPAA